MKPILKTAFSYIRYYKKQTVTILLSVILSTMLLTGISSLVYSGTQSQLENNRKIFGDWHYYFDTDNNITENVQTYMTDTGYNITKVGIMEKREIIEEPYIISMLYGDENYLEMMGLSFKQGRYPERNDEIALDEYTLHNILPDGVVGSKVRLDGTLYTITGILSKASIIEETEMRTFVCSDTADTQYPQRLYVKFQENKNLSSQVTHLAKKLNISISKLHTNWDVTSYLGGTPLRLLPKIIKTGLHLPEGKLAFIFGNLNESFHLTENVVRVVLALFSGFIIYSIFSISIWKRISQYGILQVLGVDDKSIFGMLLSELYTLFLIGFPIGIILGNATAKIIYSKAAFIFTGYDVASAGFTVDKTTIWFCLIFLALFFTVMGLCLIKRFKKMTVIQMMRKSGRRERRSRRIFSTKTERMTAVLTGKFMFAKKGTFLGILISLSLGGLVFLSTNFVIINTAQNNELTMKSDDGLGSDIQLYMESSDLSQVIPEQTAIQIKELENFQSVYSTSYLLGEVPFMNGEWTWESYYPEIAIKTDPKREAEIDPGIIEAYNGTITDEDDGNYKIKTNVYGYDEGMLEELKEYILEGQFQTEDMKQSNTIILQTLMDGQGNYDGLKVKPGDKITLKVPKFQGADPQVLRFQSPDSEYITKEFVIAAIVSRSLGKNDFFIGSGEDHLSVIMTNWQMQENFGVSGYTSLSLQLKDRTASKAADQQLQKLISGIDRCILKDYTTEIDRQNGFLQQKMFFFYGIAVLLFIISLFHIMNSMSFLVLSRRHEFGILRAMGITSEGFLKMMIREGIRYGILSGIVTAAGFLIIRQVLLYFLQHVYLYVYSGSNVSITTILSIMLANLIVGILAVLIPTRQILRENIILQIKN